LIDPPYEEPGELGRLAAEMAKALRKWPTGLFMGWYPIKDPREVDGPAATLAEAAAEKGLRLELMVDSPAEPERLNGCGLSCSIRLGRCARRPTSSCRRWRRD
jgi:23S rRNA (adenine2030-N6)-methyltransferase